MPVDPVFPANFSAIPRWSKAAPARIAILPAAY
jgi:hypothetical protein